MSFFRKQKPIKYIYFFWIIVKIIYSPIFCNEIFSNFHNFSIEKDSFFPKKKLHWQEEEIVIPKSIWKKRSKVFNKIVGEKLRYTIKNNTLISIEDENYFIYYQERFYKNPFYVFVRGKNKKVAIVKKKVLNMIKEENLKSKIIPIDLIIDNEAPEIKIIPISNEFKIEENNIVFSEKIRLTIKIKDDFSYLKKIKIEIEKKEPIEKKIKNKKNIFVETIDIFSESENKTIPITVSASDYLGNEIKKIFLLKSIINIPTTKIFIKQKETLSKLQKKSLGNYFLELDDKEEVLLFFDPPHDEVDVYAFLEEKNTNEKKSIKNLFKKINNDEAIKINKKGYLYFYTVDKIGNKSTVKYLEIGKKNKEYKIEIKTF